MLGLIRQLGALLLAALVTAIIGSIFSTQSVIAGLQSVNIDIPLSARLSMTFNDLGILPSLFPITAVCFLVGFSVAALCNRSFGGNRTLWMIIAGACALMATLIVLKAVFVVTAIAGTRSTIGFLSFGVAGGFGGWVYAKLSSRLLVKSNPAHSAVASTINSTE